MDIIQEIINYMEQIERKGCCWNIYFTKKAKTYYSTYAPNVDNTISGDLFSLIKDNLSEHVSKESVSYSPTGYRDETIESCDAHFVRNLDEVLESFGSLQNTSTSLKPDDLTFYCLEVKDEETQFEAKFFRRISKFRRLHTKGILAWFSGDALNRMEQQILGLDGFIDLVLYKDVFYIFNHIALERIFRLDEQFQDCATQALTILGESNKISNFESFEEDCMNDKRFQRILSKMLDESEDLVSAFDNFGNIISTIDLFELDIEVLGEGNNRQIQYTGKDKLMDMLRIIRDSYYKSTICEKTGIDDKI